MPRRKSTFDHDRETRILFACALRFDGWAYQDATGFDHCDALDTFFATGRLPDSPDERLCTFFGLQRGLGKWGLEHELPQGHYWRAFRALFLSVYDQPIPERFAMADYVERWNLTYAPDLPKHVALVRRIHETIAYDDDAPPLD